MFLLLLQVLWIAPSSFANCNLDQLKIALVNLSDQIARPAVDAYSPNSSSEVKKVYTILNADLRKKVAFGRQKIWREDRAIVGRTEFYGTNIASKTIVTGDYAYYCTCEAKSKLPAADDLGQVSCKLDYRTEKESEMEGLFNAAMIYSSTMDGLINAARDYNPHEQTPIVQLKNRDQIIFISRIEDKHPQKVNHAFYEKIKPWAIEK